MKKIFSNQLFFYALLSIFVVFALIIAGSFFYKEPKLEIEIQNGFAQDIKKGETLQYNIYEYQNDILQEPQLLSFVYLGNKCVETFFENQSIAKHCGSDLTVQFPLLLAYPKKMGTTSIVLYSTQEGKREEISKIEYTSLRKLEYKGRNCIEFFSSTGEKFIVEEKTGIILFMDSKYMRAELVE